MSEDGCIADAPLRPRRAVKALFLDRGRGVRRGAAARDRARRLQVARRIAHQSVRAAAGWEWENYAGILLSKRYWQLLGNSLIISGLTVALTLIAASMAAFTFAHVKFFGSSMLLSYLTWACCFRPPPPSCRCSSRCAISACSTPISAWCCRRWRSALAMSILLLRRFFRDLPHELLEAALVDGCSYINFFRYVTLPLSRPILATVGTIAFVNSWNAYLLPLIMLNSDALYPWPLGIMVYQGEYSSEWNLILAFITLTILPTIVLFLVAQKHIVAGLTAGAVKG